jgi:hypothetical protein
MVIVFIVTMLINLPSNHRLSDFGQINKENKAATPALSRSGGPHIMKSTIFNTFLVPTQLAVYREQVDNTAQDRRAPAATRNQDQSEVIRNILTNKSIWGKDFATALKTIPYMEDSGEQNVLIFHDRVVGTTPYLKTNVGAISAARHASKEVNSDITKGEKKLGGRNSMGTAQPLAFPEDNSERVALINTRNQYLAPDTTITTIKQQLGAPQNITKHSVSSLKEDRPEVLIYYHYAGDAVIFVTSNIKDYGYVNRVILNAPVVKAALGLK